MTNNFYGNQYNTRLNNLTQNEAAEALYLEWKRDQQIAKAKVLAANIDIFFGGMPVSETSSIVSAQSRERNNRTCAKIFQKSKPMRLFENSTDEGSIGDSHQLTSTAIGHSNAIDRDHRNMKGRGFNISDFDLMLLETNYNIYNQE
ncbi:hypothetical protein E3Q06_04373 [Wallemia mellicola]|nr:hypothetical protein E3Q24_04375 [Wallemia mellicola]TIB78573.1 hypothetical protein E3Q21_04376 [Wallemia mellicola]TIB82983.1 hypothetical protein E3Q20_04354 [Wallemia mellicola]TIC18807.1 hypothetical protein E3Q12_04391 [Wallemia mellicola]TIC30082.1 hypothetical protein E3Q09_04358 [Wallemia mellicola]